MSEDGIIWDSTTLSVDRSFIFVRPPKPHPQTPEPPNKTAEPTPSTDASAQPDEA